MTRICPNYHITYLQKEILGNDSIRYPKIVFGKINKKGWTIAFAMTKQGRKKEEKKSIALESKEIL